MSNEEIYRLHSRAVKEFYLRPGYLVRRLVNVRAPYELWANVTEAYSLLFD